MMKKRSILTAICALMCAFSIGASSCSALEGLLGGESASQTDSIVTSEKPTTSESPSASEEPETSEDPGTSEDPETSETPETSEAPGTSETPETPSTPAQVKLAVTSPENGEEVFPYVDEAKAFLQAGAGADVANYYEKMDNAYAPVTLKWSLSGRGTSKILVEYATKADYSDAITVEVGGSTRSIDVYNLYKATNYYLRVTAKNSKGETLGQAESQFTTTSLGPRVMNVEGICNVRDIGGFESSLGKTIQQGIAYRGGALKDNNSKLANGEWLELTDEGKRMMSEVMGIRGELDLRNENESGIKVSDGSLIPGAKLTYITAGGYEDIFHKEGGGKVYREIFKYLADKNNYPVYFHCTAGADRTGSVAYLLQAFLGMSELECHQNFAFTSFSIYGIRGSHSGAGSNATRYWNMVNMLNEFEGANLQEKAENLLLYIGVTQAELDNIKAIFFGEVEITPPSNDETTATLTMTAPSGEVFPYVEKARQYLAAGEGADVGDYYVDVDNPQVPITVEWEAEGITASKYLVEYATNENFTDALAVEVRGTASAVGLYNLYKATTYYVRISALDEQGDVIKKDYGEFYTTSLGPRVMDIEGVHNVRDLGGYETSLGKTIVQGIAYRGGSLTNPPKDSHFNNDITEAGKKYMSEGMGIKAELDFRTPEESGVVGGSVIPGAELTYITLGGYTSAFGSVAYRKFFSYLADENNYPLYYHCTGGADRTGTVTFMLHALLGVSELECIQGFAFTTYSIYKYRAAEGQLYWKEFQDMVARLKAYEGDTFQEKAENYVLSLGVTELEIYNIKAIFFGEPTKAAVSAPTSYIQGVDGDFEISVTGKKTPAKVYFGTEAVDFTYADNKIIVTADAIPNLYNGTVEGKVVFTDNSEVTFATTWVLVDVRASSLINFMSDGKVTLTDNKALLFSDGAVGYGKTVMVNMSTTTVEKTLGGFRVFIGSYGFECRGGEMRPYSLDANGTMKEVMRDGGLGLSNTIMNEGATLYMNVSFINDKPVLTIIVEKDKVMTAHTYTFANRVANEITDGNAKLGFWIRTDAVTSLTVYHETAWANK